MAQGAVLSTTALTALGLASLPEPARIARLAAIVRRGPVTPERVQQVCAELHQPATVCHQVLEESLRQVRARQARPRGWIFQRGSVEDRRAALVRAVFGRAHHHAHPYADFADLAFRGGAAIALVKPFGRPTRRAVLLVRVLEHPLMRVRVPASLETIDRVLGWLVREDLPDSPAADAFWRWCLARGRTPRQARGRG